MTNLYTYSSQLGAAQTQYIAELERLGNQVREDLIKGFCDAKNFHFTSSNGDWAFIDADQTLVDDKTLPHLVRDTLNLEVRYSETMGVYVMDYTPETWEGLTSCNQSNL